MTHVSYSTQQPSRAPTPHPPSHLTNPTQPPNNVNPTVHSPTHHIVNTITANTVNSIPAVINIHIEHNVHTAHNTLPTAHVSSVETVNSTPTTTASPYANNAHPSDLLPITTPAHLHDLLTPISYTNTSSYLRYMLHYSPSRPPRPSP